MKVDNTVKRETIYISIVTLALSVIMEIVFAAVGEWDIFVLLGNILGGLIAVLNFFLMGLTVQKAVTLEEKEARDRMKLSMTLRSFLLMAAAVVGILVPCFNAAAAIIPLFFVRIAISLRPIFIKDAEDGTDSEAPTHEG